MSSKLSARTSFRSRIDQSPCPVHAKVLICATPRTGSNLLCRAMIHHGIGIPNEYFHYLHAAIMDHDSGLMRCEMAGCCNRKVRYGGLHSGAHKSANLNGIFSAKVQSWEFVSFLDNPEGAELFQNAKFIHLYREDLLGQAISLHI